MSGAAAQERPFWRRLLGCLGMVLLYGTIYALVSDLFEDGALNRGWRENSLRGALVGLLMAAAMSFAMRLRLPVKFRPKIPPDPS